MQVGGQILIGQLIRVALTADTVAQPGIGAWETVAWALGHTSGWVEDGGVTAHDGARIGGHRRTDVVAAIRRIAQIGADPLDLHNCRCNRGGGPGGLRLGDSGLVDNQGFTFGRFDHRQHFHLEDDRALFVAF